MSSVGNAFQSEAKRSYLTARVFNADFYSYNQTVNPTTFQVSFALGAVVGATSGNCPVGRFLHETGRKLIPRANGGVNTLMVGVYDPVSGLSGFIDPNCESFTIMNTDKSANIETIVAGANSQSVFGLNPNGSTSDLANPVYTRGDVTALGQATITSNITSVSGNITATTGGLFLPTRTGTFSMAGATDTGAFFKQWVDTGASSNLTSSAIVLTQCTGFSGQNNTISVEEVGTSNRYFRAVMPDNGVSGPSSNTYFYMYFNS